MPEELFETNPGLYEDKEVPLKDRPVQAFGEDVTMNWESTEELVKQEEAPTNLVGGEGMIRKDFGREVASDDLISENRPETVSQNMVGEAQSPSATENFGQVNTADMAAGESTFMPEVPLPPKPEEINFFGAFQKADEQAPAETPESKEQEAA